MVSPTVVPDHRGLGRYLPPLSMAIPMLIFAGASLAVPLAAARALQLTEPQVGAWILVLYGLPALLSLPPDVRRAGACARQAARGPAV